MRANCRVDHFEWQHGELITQSVSPTCEYRAARAARKYNVSILSEKKKYLDFFPKKFHAFAAEFAWFFSVVDLTMIFNIFQLSKRTPLHLNFRYLSTDNRTIIKK